MILSCHTGEPFFDPFGREGPFAGPTAPDDIENHKPGVKICILTGREGGGAEDGFDDVSPLGTLGIGPNPDVVLVVGEPFGKGWRRKPGGHTASPVPAHQGDEIADAIQEPFFHCVWDGLMAVGGEKPGLNAFAYGLVYRPNTHPKVFRQLLIGLPAARTEDFQQN